MMPRVSSVAKTTPAATPSGVLSSPRAPKATRNTKSTATTIAATARTNIRISRLDWRRAWSWRSKKFMRVRAPENARPVAGRARGSEGNLGRFALGRLGDLEQGGGDEAEHAGEEVRREHLALVVVGHHAVVVGLAREGDAVLGRG